MKQNEVLQQEVQDALKWEPLLRATEIKVSVLAGVITLTGIVDSYEKMSAAGEAAKKVKGVKSIISEIKIEFGVNSKNDDNEIAIKVMNALNWNWEVPNDMINVKVEDGWVMLEGDLHWNYQREAANKSINNLKGVKGFTNKINIRSEINHEIEKRLIENALMLNWATTNQDIRVNHSDHNVILNGSVESIYQKDEAEKIAWNALGVWTVENELLVEYNS